MTTRAFRSSAHARGNSIIDTYVTGLLETIDARFYSGDPGTRQWMLSGMFYAIDGIESAPVGSWEIVQWLPLSAPLPKKLKDVFIEPYYHSNFARLTSYGIRKD